jgi:phenylpropionate dioxygenase-like ring-hydroxylating dioxygenase large terminal subunit
MLKNFWYAVEFSHAVTNKPMQMVCLGQKFVLWRDTNGKVNCLSDLCVHRGGALSGGWLAGDSIVCPYHGWEYDGEGNCLKIPAHPQRGIPKKARVDSYPTQERYGLIWAFLGDLPEDQRPPIPDVPELENPNYRKVYGEYWWPVNYERAIENAMDPSHAAYVHGNRFGNLDKPEVADFEVQTTPWQGLAEIALYPPVSGLKGPWKRLLKKTDAAKQKDVYTQTKAGYFLPNMNILHVPLPIGNMYLFDINVPINEKLTRSMFIACRDFAKHKMFDKDTLRRTHYIFKQDDDVISRQRPEMVPFNLSDEMHVRSDALQVSYRRRRNELIEDGWGIDMHQIVGDGPRDIAYVIPSPARRNNPELERAWVHKEADSAKALGKAENHDKEATAGGQAQFEMEDNESQSAASETQHEVTA